MKGLLIIGAGGMAKCILDCVLAEGRFDRIGFLVDDAEGDFDGYPILGKIEEAPKFRVSYPYAHIAIGDNAFRKKTYYWLKKEGFEMPTIIHPATVISPKSKIGDGTVVLPGAIVDAHVEIGSNCLISTNTYVAHDSVVGNHVHLSPKTGLMGGVIVGDETWIGAGSTVSDHKTIGRNCMLGAGSVVVKDIPDYSKAYGVPARVVASTQE